MFRYYWLIKKNPYKQETYTKRSLFVQHIVQAYKRKLTSYHPTIYLYLYSIVYTNTYTNNLFSNWLVIASLEQRKTSNLPKLLRASCHIYFFFIFLTDMPFASIDFFHSYIKHSRYNCIPVYRPQHKIVNIGEEI